MITLFFLIVRTTALPSVVSQTTNPEPGLKHKVKAVIMCTVKGTRLSWETIALIDNGQTLKQDGVISKADWQAMQYPETEPQEPGRGPVATAAKGAVMSDNGVVAERARMTIRLGGRTVPFRP